MCRQDDDSIGKKGLVININNHIYTYLVLQSLANGERLVGDLTVRYPG